MKKRVLILSYSLCFGGIEKSLLELLNNFDYEKSEVTLFLEHFEGELKGEVNPNVRIIDYNISESKNIFFRKFINGFKRIHFLLTQKKFDTSICYATYSKICSLLALKTSNNPIFYVHGDYVEEFQDTPRTRCFFESQEIDKFKKVIFVSNESKHNLVQIMPSIENKSIVLNNFINHEKIIKLSKEKIQFQREKGCTYFVYVGRLDEQVKKVSKLIEVVEYLKEKKNPVKLLIVGDGPSKNRYETLIQEKGLEMDCFLIGAKKNPYPYMELADYVVLTSKHEGFPVTLLEALVLKKNIISTISLSDEYLDLKDYCFIVSQDTEKMKVEIEEILTKKAKPKTVDFAKLNQERMKILESIVDGEI